MRDFQLQKCSEDIAATFQHNRRSPQMFWWFSRHHLAKVSWDLAKIKLLYLRLYISWWDNLLGCFFLEFLLCKWKCPVALWRLTFSICRHMTNLWVWRNKAFLPSLWGVKKKAWKSHCVSQSTSVDAKGKLAELPLFICIFQASEGKHEVSKVYEARVMAKGLPLLA